MSFVGPSGDSAEAEAAESITTGRRQQAARRDIESLLDVQD
jgi:hypothetical protein